MNEITVYPPGEFTHEEFAAANGKTKPDTYLQVKELVANGAIIVSGQRPAKGGRGRPSTLYKVNDNVPVQPVTIVKDHETDVVMPSGEQITVEVFNVVPVEPEPVPVTEKVEVTNPDLKEISQSCPCCHKPLHSINDATGVMVWCSKGPEVCKSTEAPFGHGKNVLTAYDTLIEKWTKAMAG